MLFSALIPLTKIYPHISYLANILSYSFVCNEYKSRKKCLKRFKTFPAIYVIILIMKMSNILMLMAIFQKIPNANNTSPFRLPAPFCIHSDRTNSKITQTFRALYKHEQAFFFFPLDHICTCLFNGTLILFQWKNASNNNINDF